ncbi:MAG: bis(5-nucleosyl)-tetraphosphatase, symmetrical [Gammaproteobacteria bacterium]|nr:bis(5-nucleosyl)-tetraphosphatase, symmetrical [Gammaproteobacteria bacterium]
MATYAIGDIQGCYKTLSYLLKTIAFNPKHDRLWLVGDVINRGMGSLAVLNYLYDIQDRCVLVLGNHDLHLIAVFAGVAPLKKADTFSDILEHAKANLLCTWLRVQPLLHYDHALNAVMTHAGIYPLWALNTAQRLAQEVEALLRHEDHKSFLKVLYGNEPSLWNENLKGYDRARFIVNAFTRMRVMRSDGHLELDYKGSVENCPNGLLPWFKLPSLFNQNTRVIFGHWAQCILPIPYQNLYLIDTGCVWGRQLTALRLEDGKVFAVESQEY